MPFGGGHQFFRLFNGATASDQSAVISRLADLNEGRGMRSFLGRTVTEPPAEWQSSCPLRLI